MHDFSRTPTPYTSISARASLTLAGYHYISTQVIFSVEPLGLSNDGNDIIKHIT